MPVARIFQRGRKILLAFAFEFFLGSFEVCHARRNFFALARQTIVSFAHAHPLLSRVPRILAFVIGARMRVWRCKIVFVDKSRGCL